jgi:uncharacterized Zn-finger protein
MSSNQSVTIRVDDAEESARCDGGAGALGHPLIYLPFDGGTFVDCYYCGRRFAKSRYLEERSDSAKRSAA